MKQFGDLSEGWPFCLGLFYLSDRGMAGNTGYRPRAYEAQSWLIHLSIPKTKFFAFSVGRAGVSLLDFQKRFVNKSVVVPSHRLRNPATYCRRIVRFGKQLPHHSPLVTSTIQRVNALAADSAEEIQ